jgi:hypothetical protein
MRKPLVLLYLTLLTLGTSARPQQATQVVLLAHEVLRPDSARAFDANERRIAQTCIRLGCPHPYIAAVPITSSASLTDVWWVNVFPSRDAMAATERAWTSPTLRNALEPWSTRKAGFRRQLTSVVLTAVSGAPSALDLARARFLVLLVDREPNAVAQRRGAFVSGDSLMANIQAAHTKSDAHALTARLRSVSTTVLRVVPEWSVPAPEWVRADRSFWRQRASITP